HVHVPDAVWGLGDGLTAGVPMAVANAALSRLLGAASVSWLVIAIAFPIGGCGAARLVKGPYAAKVAAGLLYVLSPMVYERIWAGQVGFLLGYAVLPWYVESLHKTRDASGLRRARPALWWLGLIVLSPHFAFIGGLFTVAALVADRLRWR